MTYTGSAVKEPVQLRDLLQNGLKAQGDEPALVSLEGAWSWSELERRAASLAARYLALGLAPGDRVASLMPNRLALIAHYLACFKAGLVLTPLNYRYTPREIDHALSVSEAKIIVAHAERSDDIAASTAKDLPLGVIFYEAHDGTERSLERLMDAAAPAVALPVPAPDSPAAIFFTSGSTGPAKGVTHTVSSLGWIFASAATSFKFTPDDTVLAGSSCTHVGGFTVTLAALSAGARVAVARAFDHTELGPLMRAARPTFLSMLPAALLHLIREQGTAADDFSSLRLCRSAGDKVPAELQKEFIALTGKPVSEGYGMTEFGLAALNSPGKHSKFGSVGLPSPGFSFSIRDGNGQEAPTGQEGRLWARTPTQSSCYWNDPVASAEVVHDGWFDTGDVMKADADGCLWFCGRQKQIIVHDGSNVAPQEVEDALLEHPSVENAGVIGVHDLAHGENVRAYVALKPNMPRPNAGELIQFAKARVGYKAPEEIVFIDKMPLNPTGKVDRVALKTLAAGDHAHIR